MTKRMTPTQAFDAALREEERMNLWYDEIENAFSGYAGTTNAEPDEGEE